MKRIEMDTVAWNNYSIDDQEKIVNKYEVILVNYVPAKKLPFRRFKIKSDKIIEKIIKGADMAAKGADMAAKGADMTAKMIDEFTYQLDKNMKPFAKTEGLARAAFGRFSDQNVEETFYGKGGKKGLMETFYGKRKPGPKRSWYKTLMAGNAPPKKRGRPRKTRGFMETFYGSTKKGVKSGSSWVDAFMNPPKPKRGRGRPRKQPSMMDTFFGPSRKTRSRRKTSTFYNVMWGKPSRRRKGSSSDWGFGGGSSWGGGGMSDKDTMKYFGL